LLVEEAHLRGEILRYFSSAPVTRWLRQIQEKMPSFARNQRQFRRGVSDLRMPGMINGLDVVSFKIASLRNRLDFDDRLWL
jgi:hypothetical protein